MPTDMKRSNHTDDAPRKAVIVRALNRGGESVVTIDGRYRLPAFFRRLIPRWPWVRLRIG